MNANNFSGSSVSIELPAEKLTQRQENSMELFSCAIGEHITQLMTLTSQKKDNVSTGKKRPADRPKANAKNTKGNEM